MNKIIAALVAAGNPISANATEEQVVEVISGLLGQVKNLRTDNDNLKAQATQARKEKITAHVQSKVDAKCITAEQKDGWVNAIMADSNAQVLLDGIPAPKADAPTYPKRPGAPPLPKEESNTAEGVQARMQELREQLKTASPTEASVIAKQLRELRGHKDLLAQEPAK